MLHDMHARQAFLTCYVIGSRSDSMGQTLRRVQLGMLFDHNVLLDVPTSAFLSMAVNSSLCMRWTVRCRCVLFRLSILIDQSSLQCQYC